MKTSFDFYGCKPFPEVIKKDNALFSSKKEQDFVCLEVVLQKQFSELESQVKSIWVKSSCREKEWAKSFLELNGDTKVIAVPITEVIFYETV
jgi:hypothetical protein